MTTSKLSPAKDVMARKRQQKLAAALRTNLRRRKEQARDRAETVELVNATVDPGDAADMPQAPQTSDRQG